MTVTISNNKMYFFKDKDGKVVLWQAPNIPLYGWFVFKILSMLFDAKQPKSGFESLSSAFIFTWAFLELTSGVNYFRRSIGLIVFVLMIVGFFR